MNMRSMNIAGGFFLLLLISTGSVFAGPLPSVESIFPKVSQYLAEPEEQATTWSASNVGTGLLSETNGETIPEVSLNVSQKNRHTRQTSLTTGTLPALNNYLFFANRQFLVKINCDGTGVQPFRLTRSDEDGGPFNAIASDFDVREHLLFWSDVQTGALYKVYENGTGLVELLNTNVVTPDGMAWDWVNKKLYWTDAGTKTLEVYDPESTHRRILFRTGSTSNPRAIVLDPAKKQMYWTDWGENPSIQRASMDGTSRISLHTTGLVWPNGMTIDYATQTLYWADASLDRIETSSVDGTGRRVLTTQFIFHPFGMTFFRGDLFWTDWQLKALLTVSVSPPMTFKAVIQNLIFDPMAIHAIALERQPTALNPCRSSNGGCSHLCLLSTSNMQGFTCVCPDGMYISTDRKTCVSGASLPALPSTQQTCSPECQNNGLCVSPDVCACMAGWNGSSCDQPICTPQCQNGGTCVDVGVCSCTDDWEGSTCEQPICDHGYCLNGGSCTGPNICTCQEGSGWSGPRCNQPVCAVDCVNGRGCVVPNTCLCDHGWIGQLCDRPVCNPPCEHGSCIRPDECKCDDGWTHVLCDEPVCDQVCEHDGDCVAPNTCDCTSGYTGAHCETPICFPPDGCQHGGLCISHNICLCGTMFSGIDCATAVCSPQCEHEGTCFHNASTGNNECRCPPLAYKGPTCSEAICTQECEHGTCVGPNLCVCHTGYHGTRCQHPICDPSCENGGTCTAPDTCVCPIQYTGSRCEIQRKD